MSQFCFYQGKDPAVVERLRRACETQWTDIVQYQRDDFQLFLPADTAEISFAETNTALGAISGYVRTDELRDRIGRSRERLHNERFISTIIDKTRWPLTDSWTGSFAAVAYAKAERKVVLCNDVLGYLPVYFANRNEGVIGGTSLIVLGRAIQLKVDPVGVFQRTRVPRSNYGRRTLFQDVSRPLPGEWVRLAPGSSHFESVFDNTLCRETVAEEPHALAPTIWKLLEREIQLIVGAPAQLSVALSGGWDSRLVLRGAADCTESLQAFTYGSEDIYESVIARRCADRVGARHQCFGIQNKFFPSRKEMQQLVRETEAANFLVWFPIIEALKSRGNRKHIVLLGDHCESIDGRNMSTVATRMHRARSFFAPLLGKREQFESATPELMQAWRQAKKKEILAGLTPCYERLSDELTAQCPLEMALSETTRDIDLSLDRVDQIQPRFAVMFDEVFAWFHKARLSIATQNLLLSCAGRAISPMMSTRSLRMLSSLHPRVRVRRRLMNALARLPEFDELAKVPSAQIPWLSARAPEPLREMIWGLRSGIDQLLIRRALRTKNPSQRRRLLKSLDWVEEYRRENAELNVRSWFSGRWIKAEPFVARVGSRAKLNSWPCINEDIAAVANTSIMLDLSCGD